MDSLAAPTRCGIDRGSEAGSERALVADGEPLLQVRDLCIRYGAVTAVRGVSLTIGQGECVAVIGPNGSGKSSLLSAIAGLVRPSSGEILWSGAALHRASIEVILRSGIALVPEGRHVFSSMTVEENLDLGATIRSDHKSARADLHEMYRLFPRLRERRDQPAGRLSGGEQQQLAIARALMCRPRLLMLDEPSLGLAPAITDQVYAVLRQLRSEGTTILLVEQNTARALNIADHAHILSNGLVRLSGTPADLRSNPDFEAAYFGTAMTGAAGQ